MENAARLGNGMTTHGLKASLLLCLDLAALAGARPAAAQDMKELVAPYVQARDAHAVGQIAGHAYGDPSHPSGPAIPYGGVSVLVLPRSAGFESELDGIRDHFRDSLRNYMTAAADIAAARTAYERKLLWAGGGELIRGEVSDGGGLVKLTGVPVGEWLLLAWRKEPHPAKAARPRQPGTKEFRDIPVSTGYALLSYWRMRLQVRADETTSVDLNDRNVWITAVREDLYLTQGTPKKAEPRMRR